MKDMHHVHEVLEMLSFANQEFTLKDLENEIKSTFGEDAQFLNCADKNFNASEVIDFMLEKNKIEEHDGLIRLKSLPCSH